MAKVTFYTHINDKLLFACQLIKTINKREQPVLVWVEHQETLAILDQMLWTFEKNSFLPHDVWQEGSDFPDTSAIVLCAGVHLPEKAPLPVVLNLSQQYWQDISHVDRVLELIGSGEEELAFARQRFKAYRQADFIIEHHNMSHRQI